MSPAARRPTRGGSRAACSRRAARPWVAALLLLAAARAPAVAAQGSDTPVWGGEGGAPYGLSCLPGDVLIGIAGWESSSVERIGGICTAIDVEGRWVGSLRPTDPQTRGGRDGTRYERVCPRDHAVKGYQGLFGSHVHRLEIICQPVGAGGRTGGVTRTLPPVGGSEGAARGPYYCEDQMPARALIGRARSNVAAVGLRCAYPTIGFGWFAYISTSNTREPVGTRLGSAEDVIAGHNIRQIVTDADVKVGAGPACQSCHTGVGTPGSFDAATIERSGFCELVAVFNAAEKPQILKNLFNDWRSRGCPD